MPDTLKKLIVFDLDGTLADSKAALDDEMAQLVISLLKVAQVAIISGGDWPQFQKQVLSHLPENQALANLSILPTCGTKYYRYKSDWKKLYSEDFTKAEKTKIITSLNHAVKESGFKNEKIWGKLIENRRSQITYSGLGQQAPLDAKKIWDPHFTKRKKNKRKTR